MLRAFGRGFLMVGTGATAALMAVGTPEKNPFGPDTRSLTTDYADPMESFVMKVITRVVPATWLRNLVVDGGAPRLRPLDVFDRFGEDPYTITEIEAGKVWLVSYEGPVMMPPSTFILKDTPNNRNKAVLGAASNPRDTLKAANEDFDRLQEYLAMSQKIWEKGGKAQGYQERLNMMVVRLNSGRLLLYCPVVIHEGTKLQKWLTSLGQVKYLVIGSNSHTTFLPSVIKRFPNASVIGPSLAEAKLLVTDTGLPRGKFDFLTTSPSHLEQLNQRLAPEGVSLHASEDCGTQCVAALSHRTLLEVDLLYRHHSLCACLGCTSGVSTDRPHAVARTFTRALCSPPNATNGYLPYYRFASMDPSSCLSHFSFPPPAADGSSCSKMHAAIEGIARLEFDQALSVHSPTCIPGDDFRTTLQATWAWLQQEL